MLKELATSKAKFILDTTICKNMAIWYLFLCREGDIDISFFVWLWKAFKAEEHDAFG